ncbi:MULTISPECIES: hypothetical protein [Myxococcus]|uniref:hypothetical protein n=1 Tax=Myxococcus TaxID=32 RepID=UPI0011431019|nr:MULTISPECIES: hypothetical protein [Myxococcus]MCK8498485.1 hypothetical protein [Myxococcus fulvus]
MSPSRVLRNLVLSTAAVLLPSTLAWSETPQVDVPYVFETVDSYAITEANVIEIRGVLQGESAPRTFEFEFYSNPAYYDASQHGSRCDRMALLAMTRPGRYLLELKVQRWIGGQPSCRLTRRTAQPTP